ncbi:ABC transporter ATP-binding protein [Papillibacter cinnamivorans]|uniref:ABC-2 type transport system ATP-binding protein n=1 Tax=Papillibacter cinnamivorans DSM 12816 TaxID=1122930 RepID=A0A1W2B7P2_9FIRM|nr:ABC transporter ATP-binding protein [Papillibacter cinnamivorans]SMC68946.1 ABC-2 type transport system ATP-binding protein [Papillibacter cinnamivorans DSM 12816]
MNPILSCEQLTKTFGSKTALAGVDLNIERGRIVGLLGPNGSGKTTLMKLANGLITPTSGRLLIDGEAPGTHSKAVVSYLPEVTYLADWMRTSDVLEFFRDFYKDFDMERALSMLKNLGIGLREPLRSMSKGTREKVQLILVMARRASLYLLDEPIGGVDPAARDYILSTIIGNYEPQSAVVISTHLISDVEKVLDDVVFINNGKIVLSSTVDEIREVKGMSVDALFREVFRC